MLTTMPHEVAASSTVQGLLVEVLRGADSELRAATLAALHQLQPLDSHVAAAVLLADTTPSNAAVCHTCTALPTRTSTQARALHTNPLSMDARLRLARHAAPSNATARVVAPLVDHPPSDSALHAALWQTLRGAAASSVLAWMDPPARRQLAAHVRRVMAVVHRAPTDWTAAAAAAVLRCRLAEAQTAAGGLGNWSTVQAMCARACALLPRGTEVADDVALHAHVLLSGSEALLRQGQILPAAAQASAALELLRHTPSAAAAHVQVSRVHASQGNLAAATEALDALDAPHPHVAVTLAALRGGFPPEAALAVPAPTPQQHAVMALLQAARQLVSDGDSASSIYKEVQPGLKEVQQTAPGLAGGVHACVLLALAAVRDTDRKAKGRAESNALKAIRRWPGGVPRAVWGVLVGGGVGGRVACCAVHACPWERDLWEGLPIGRVV